jgi:hypothetical protein
MMGARRALLIWVTVVVCAFGSRADVVPSPSETAPPPAHSIFLSGSLQANLPAEFGRQFNEVNWLLEGVAPNSALPAPSRVAPPAFREQSDTPVLREVPPVQNSAALALCALVTLGAYEGGRSLRRLYAAGAVPEWYHTGGPQQIGHATPFDLETPALPACVFEQPSDLQRGFSYRIPRERRSRFCPQFFLLIEAPRGPPAFS